MNTMVDQLNAFAAEVTRVAREVGTEGKLGGQAVVPGVAGTWKDLTDNVNVMAANLTAQVRGIVKVVTAVANGSFKEKLTVEAKGEVAALAETINGMTDTLAIFAEQVTTVAREVGVEGRLGGQANVPGAAGIWKDLTDNVNLLAANLTTQVRAIADVATAVTKGDLTREIQVDARGEVVELKDNINAMIRNLRDDDGTEHRAGLAENQPGAVHQHAPGSARFDHGRPDAALRAGAAGQRAIRRDIPDGRGQRRAPSGHARELRRAMSQEERSTARAGRRPGRSMRSEKSRILLTRYPARLRSRSLRSGRSAAAKSDRLARVVRRPRRKRSSSLRPSKDSLRPT